MATITPATTYPAGALNIAGHNANIFSTTAGQGVLSEPNGGLEQANLDPAFAVRDEHVMSEEAVRATQDSMVLPMDVFSNGFGDSGEDEDSTREKTYVTVAGLSHRVYFPFNARHVMWQWSLFSSVYHPVFFDNQSGFSRNNLIIRAYLDGQPMAAFTRPLVPSAQLLTGIGPPANNALAEDYEDSTAMWYDFSRLTVNVQEGYHELNIKVYMERNARSVALVAEGIIPDADDPADTYDYYAHNRITFGVRNVRCVSFA